MQCTGRGIAGEVVNVCPGRHTAKAEGAEQWPLKDKDISMP